MKKSKTILLVAFAAVVIVVAVVAIQINNLPEADEASLVGADLGVDVLAQDAKIPTENLSKTETYLKAEQTQFQKEEQYNKMVEGSEAKRLTSTVEDALESTYDKKMKDLKNRDLTASYKPSSVNVATGKTEDNNIYNTVASSENNSKKTKPTVLKSSIPTNRKMELQKPTNESKAEEAYFNFVENTESGTETAKVAEESTMIKAVVLGGQQVKQGSVIRFRLTEKAIIKGTEFSNKTIFFAKCSFGADRLNAVVERIPLKGGGFVSVNLVLHDQDLMEGIYAPVKETTEATNDEAMNSLENLLNSTGTVAGQAGTGVARVFRSATQGTQKVSVPDAYPVLFLVRSN